MRDLPGLKPTLRFLSSASFLTRGDKSERGGGGAIRTEHSRNNMPGSPNAASRASQVQHFRMQ
jgi:hypothetical protein